VTRLVHIRPEAEQDLSDAASWYETQQRDLGHRFLDEALTAIQSIAELPFRYPELQRGARRILLQRFPFGIFYTVEEDVIVVMAVMHGSRDPKRWKGRF